MEYEVATGIVTLTGAADVVHPQYNISGEVLVYDMNQQHFRGSGDEESGRIRIRLDPELIEGRKPDAEPSPEDDQPETSPPDDGRKLPQGERSSPKPMRFLGKRDGRSQWNAPR